MSAAPNTVSSAAAGGGYPTYDEYVKMAVEKKWSPTDPVEKIHATIQKYCQVQSYNATNMIMVLIIPIVQIFDLQAGDTDQQFDGYVGMLDKELRFLFEVLKASPERSFDIAPALFLALDTAQKTLFRVTKLRLASGVTR